MQNWIESEFFGYWKDAQSRITKRLSVNGPTRELSRTAWNWQKPGIKLMCRWGESAARQSLDLQAKWIDRWIQEFETESLNLQTFSTQVQRINQAMQEWSGIQSKLWKFWFELLDNALVKSEHPNPSLEMVENWKKVIKESDNDLNHWFTKWEEQINCKPLVPDELNRLTEKLGHEMLGWIQNQAVLWQYGFDFVHNAAPAGSKSAPKQKSETNSERDDLTEIRGIGPLIEQLLNEQNIVSFRQVANLSEEEMRYLEENVIRFPGRARRYEWVQQAKKLCARD